MKLLIVIDICNQCEQKYKDTSASSATLTPIKSIEESIKEKAIRRNLFLGEYPICKNIVSESDGRPSSHNFSEFLKIKMISSVVIRSLACKRIKSRFEKLKSKESSSILN